MIKHAILLKNSGGGKLFGMSRNEESSKARVYLKEMKKRGIRVIVNGEPCLYQDTKRMNLVFEGNNYMSYFECDDSGKILEVIWESVWLH